VNRRLTLILVGVIATLLLGIGAYFVLRPDFCDGLPREIGACNSDRPSYEGATCDQVAAEWGEHLDKRVAEVIAQAAASERKGASFSLYSAEVLVTQLANKHMRDLSITGDCESDRFMAIGEQQLSEVATENVGNVMYDGDPRVPYEDWRERVEANVQLILSQPDAPYAP
jgi:hypothetical protein